jgi:uncharacterized protein (TIGR02001 family)
MMVAGYAARAGALELHPGGSVAITSDYVLRGVSQTRGHGALQLDLHLQPLSGWSVGGWMSQIRPLPGHESVELDLYSQWHWLLAGDLSSTATAVYYHFPEDPRPVSYDYAELSGSISWRNAITLNATWVPRATVFSSRYGLAYDRHTQSLELTFMQRLPAQITAQAGVGHFAIPGLAGTGYSYGSASVARAFGQWQAELSYFLVQEAAYRSYTPGAAGGPWALTLSWHF